MLSNKERAILEVARTRTVEPRKKNKKQFESLVSKGFLTPNGKITKTGEIAYKTPVETEKSKEAA